MARKTERKCQKNTYIKCVVWDLDNTLWDGVLLEEGHVSLRDSVAEIIRTLDGRGILQSIASRNDYAAAMQKLGEFGLQEYFLYPQIGWGSKVPFITSIAQSLNIGLDTIAFVDDQLFEREEVRFSLPQVLCIDAANLDRLLDMPEMNPRFITPDSKIRRLMYISGTARYRAEEEFVGPKKAFLASLDMVLTIFEAEEGDLKRAEELTVRTNQLNATGYTYSYDELYQFRQSAQHKVLMARLEDRFGTYGHIGLALIECKKDIWIIELLLMSCRIMSRGVGSIMLSYIMRLAKDRNVRLRGEFVPNGRNRIMEITYRFSGFREVRQVGDLVVFESDLASIPPFPDYVNVQIVSGN